MEQVLVANVKKRNRREPLGFAFFALILFMFVYFARPEDWIPGLLAVPLAKITGILMLLAVVFSLGSIRWQLSWEIVFLGLLVAQLWLAAVFSPVWRGGAVDVMLDFSKVLPVVLAIYVAVRSIKRLHWVLLVQAGSVAAIAVASVANRHTSNGRLRGVLSGVYGNSNDLALVIDLCIPICLVLALTTRSYLQRLAWSVAMLAMIYAVLLTASRAGALSLAVLVLVCLWQFGVKSRRFYLLLFVPLAVVVISLYGGHSLRERFEQTSLDSESNAPPTEASLSSQERKELLFKSMRVTGEHPFFGVGTGNFQVISGMWRVSHNTYTQISAEGGIPAFILYMLILWRGILNLAYIRRYSKMGKRNRLFSMALEASLAAYLLGSFFAAFAYELFPYCLIAYTGALRFIVQRERAVARRAAQPALPQFQTEVTAWL